MKIWKWLYPGIGVKRWLFLILTGLLLISSGIAIMVDFQLVTLFESVIYKIALTLIGRGSRVIDFLFASLIMSTGFFIINWSLKQIVSKMGKDFLPNNKLVDTLYKRKVLEKGPKVVALGGGTGLSNLLRGLKKFTSNITAVVTVADDGGSSGRLRDELGMLPPGDIRSCLVALAETEPLMEQLFQYRFRTDGQLEGHSFGNLFIASMTELLGDFEEAIKESSKVLAITGQVLPSTNEDVRLGAVYADKSVKMGESVIPEIDKKISRVFLEPAVCQPTPEALTAIREAEVIVIGPGSLYTSIIPNLLVEGIADAIRTSKALKVYICNVMTQPGETSGYTASEHIGAIVDHVGEGLFDYIILNREEGAASLARKYEEEGAFPVKVDHQMIKEKGITIIEEELLQSDDFLRHDPIRLAEVIMNIAEGR